VGALWVRDQKGREFKVGTGLTDEQRREARQLFPPGTVVTYRFFETTPSGKPRFPSFLRVRAEEPSARVSNVAALKQSLLA
jgi:DNA ligase-1